jgi:hypothetical protein
MSVSMSASNIADTDTWQSRSCTLRIVCACGRRLYQCVAHRHQHGDACHCLQCYCHQQRCHRELQRCSLTEVARPTACCCDVMCKVRQGKTPKKWDGHRKFQEELPEIWVGQYCSLLPHTLLRCHLTNNNTINITITMLRLLATSTRVIARTGVRSARSYTSRSSSTSYRLLHAAIPRNHPHPLVQTTATMTRTNTTTTTTIAMRRIANHKVEEDSPSERHLREGVEHMQANRNDEAMTSYSKAIEADPADIRPWGARAELLEYLSSYSKALNDYKRVRTVATHLINSKRAKPNTLKIASTTKPNTTRY